MKYKLLIYPLSLILAVSFLAGCKKNNDFSDIVNLANRSVAEENPDISMPQGKLYELSDGTLRAEGGLVALGNDFMRMMIEGSEREFVLSERARKEISYFNQDPKNLKIMRGTMLVVTYTKKDLIWIAESIELLMAN